MLRTRISSSRISWASCLSSFSESLCRSAGLLMVERIWLMNPSLGDEDPSLSRLRLGASWCSALQAGCSLFNLFYYPPPTQNDNRSQPIGVTGICAEGVRATSNIASNLAPDDKPSRLDIALCFLDPLF